MSLIWGESATIDPNVNTWGSVVVGSVVTGSVVAFPFGHRFFGHNSDSFGPIGLKCFTGAQETILSIDYLVMNNVSTNNLFSF